MPTSSKMQHFKKYGATAFSTQGFDGKVVGSSNSDKKSSTSSVECCDVCQRVFRDADHLAKHRRGALCRRLKQRDARRHRKIALRNMVTEEQDQLQPAKQLSLGIGAAAKRKTNTSSSSSMMYKPYQCSVCSARFYDKGNVELHLQRQHSATPQLWVQVSKAKNGPGSIPSTSETIQPVTVSSSSCNVQSIGTDGISTSDNEACSSTNISYNINSNNNCIDVSNNNDATSRIFSNDKFRCHDCNSLFDLEGQLIEHKRIVHQITQDALDAASGHVTQQQLPVSRALTHTYIPNNGGVGPLNEGVALNSNKNIITRMDPGGGNTSLNQHMFHAGYLFPSTYYSNDPASAMQQPLHSQVSPYLQHAPPLQQHAMLLSQQQHHTLQQHHEHEMVLASHSHASLVQQSQHSVVQPQHLHALHPSQQPHSHPTLLPPVAMTSPAEHGTPLLTSMSSNIGNTTDAPMLHNTASVTNTSTEQLQIATPLNTISICNNSNSNAGISFNNIVSSNSEVVLCNTSVASRSCVATNGSVTASTVACNMQSVCSTQNGRLESKAAANVTAKWNMCGNCGIKFLDLMNLELHIERKHPQLKIFGSVDFGEGTVCYKTGVVHTKGGCNTGKRKMSLDVSKSSMVSQHHTCSLCRHTSTSLTPMVEHMLNVHFLSGKNMMDAIVSIGEDGCQSTATTTTTTTYTSSIVYAGDNLPVEHLKHNECVPEIKSRPVQQQQQTQQSEQLTRTKMMAGSSRVLAKEVLPTVNGPGFKSHVSFNQNQCHSCQAEFQTAAELIRHRIKDKKHTCVICCYLTCSGKELTDHMKVEHSFTEFAIPSGAASEITEVKKELTCWRCGMDFKKTGDFIDHLKVHGSLTGKCENCGKQDYNVANILIHMTTLHSDYMNKLTIAIMSKGKTWTCTYLQTLTGDLVNSSNVTSVASNNSNINLKKSINKSSSCNDLNEHKIKSKTKKRSLENEKNKQNLKEKNASSSIRSKKILKTYACSECRVCLYGSASLERHLSLHQRRLAASSAPSSTASAVEGAASSSRSSSISNVVGGANSCHTSVSNVNGTSTLLCQSAEDVLTIKRSPSEEGLSPLLCVSSHTSADSECCYQAPSVTEQCNCPGENVGLEPLANTSGFKCEECGLTRETSTQLILHILKVHMSGNLIHMVMDDNGAVQNYPIYIVTPISAI